MLDTSAFMVDPDSDSTDAAAAGILTTPAKGTNTRTTVVIIRNAT